MLVEFVYAFNSKSYRQAVAWNFFFLHWCALNDRCCLKETGMEKYREKANLKFSSKGISAAANRYLPINKRQLYDVSSSIGAPQIIIVIEVSNKKKYGQVLRVSCQIRVVIKNNNPLMRHWALLLLKQSSVHSFKKNKIYLWNDSLGNAFFISNYLVSASNYKTPSEAVFTTSHKRTFHKWYCSHHSLAEKERGSLFIDSFLFVLHFLC